MTLGEIVEGYLIHLRHHLGQLPGCDRSPAAHKMCSTANVLSR